MGILCVSAIKKGTQEDSFLYRAITLIENVKYIPSLLNILLYTALINHYHSLTVVAV